MTSSPGLRRCAGEAACRPILECYRRRQTPATVTSLAPYIICVGGPVTNNPLDRRTAYE